MHNLLLVSFIKKPTNCVVELNQAKFYLVGFLVVSIKFRLMKESKYQQMNQEVCLMNNKM